MFNDSPVSLTRRELARQAVTGAAGMMLSSIMLSQPLPAQAQAADPEPTAPRPIDTPAASPPPSPVLDEGTLLTQLVPVNAGYALSETQAKEVAAQLKDYPGDFAKARTYTLPDDISPAFAADAPVRKERVK